MENVAQKLKDSKIVAVIRGKSPADALKKADAVIEGGIVAIEVTFTVPDADEVIKKLVKKHKGTDVLIGAGTVLDAQTAKKAVDAGAEFVVSPSFCPEVLDECERLNVFAVPGVYTPTEVTQAMEFGCKFLKLFPADIALLKALKGPFPEVDFMATGGINLDNLTDWFKAGAAAVGAGSNLTSAIDNGSPEDVVKEVKKWVARLG